MGGRGGRRRGRRNRGGSRSSVSLPMKRGRDSTASRPPPERGDYIEIGERRSAALEEYYAMQGIVPPEDFPKLLAALALPLPTAFRVTAGGRFHDDIVRKLTTEFPALFESARDKIRAASAQEGEAGAAGDAEEPLLAPERLPWYPGGLGWTVSTPRTLVRRDNALAPFHKWLVRMNELGAINRQEAVSMVPPLLIDLKPGQSVIDMCAAPGSKTAQLLDALADSAPDENALSGSGLVVANDADIKRCWLLAHQVKRFSAPNFIVTHHDAQAFPAVTSFDRVLCDVPCTGDGTLRKAPDMWRKWTPQLGNGIHRLQKNILRRGIELLKPGGRLVYSTCSMNPVENEAIISDALRHFGPDVLQLVDVSEELPQLKRRPGIRTWKVKDTRSADEAAEDDAKMNVEKMEGIVMGDSDPGNAMSKPDDAKNTYVASAAEPPVPERAKEVSTARPGGWFHSLEDVPERRRRQLHRSHFPPTEAELKSGHFPLERCVRLVPSDQDTGAFFVAVLSKSESVSKAQCVAPACQPAKAALTTKVGSVSPANGVASEAKEMEHGDGSSPMDRDSEGAHGPDVTTKDNESHSAGGAISTSGIDDNAKVNEAGGAPQVTPKRSMHSRLITDDPLVGLERVNAADVSKLADFFGLEEDRCRACLMTRGSEAATYKKVLVVSPIVRELLTKSIGSIEGEAAGVRGRLRVVNAGVRVFERTGRRDATVPFRVLSEGVQVLLRTMKKRVVPIGLEDLKLVVEQELTTVKDVVSAATRTRLTDMAPGSAFLVMGDGSSAEVIHVWLGSYKMTKVMPADELDAICTRHGLQGGKTEGKKTKQQKQQQQREGAAKSQQTAQIAAAAQAGEVGGLAPGLPNTTAVTGSVATCPEHVGEGLMSKVSGGEPGSDVVEQVGSSVTGKEHVKELASAKR